MSGEDATLARVSPRRHSCAFVLLALAACGDPPDDTPLGRDIAVTMARPEQSVDKVTVQHVLVAFVGAKRGSESGRTEAAARSLTFDLLARARAGEDFAGLVQQYSGDEGGGTYTLTQDDRDDYARNFGDVAFRLAPGEIGVAAYHRVRSPFGWHLVKRLE